MSVTSEKNDFSYHIPSAVLKILLKDKTTRKNILWCTKDYEEYGQGFLETDTIEISRITGEYSGIIRPYAEKERKIRAARIRTRGEVFTPRHICNKQNNLIDNPWFGRENVFNKPDGNSFSVNKRKIRFGKENDWKKYIYSKRLEITCGEAPYLVNPYDISTGEPIPLFERIGLLDRKFRIIKENCKNREDWLKWAERAMKSVYGYEFQGDSVLLARENLLFTYMDYYKDKFGKYPETRLLKSVANIIAWNIWQMDGLKCVAPYSCRPEETADGQITVFDPKESRKISQKGTLIHPARFLFNAGKTPKSWNNRILSDPHLCVADYWADSGCVFSNVDVKGGIAVTYWDDKKEYEPIGTFVVHEELKTILKKVKAATDFYLSEMVYPRDLYHLSDSLYNENKWAEKRQSKPPIPQWYPFYDKPDYKLQLLFARCIGADFWLLHHEEGDCDENSVISFFRITDVSHKEKYFIRSDYRALSLPLTGENSFDEKVRHFISNGEIPFQNNDRKLFCPNCGSEVGFSKKGVYYCRKMCGMMLGYLRPNVPLAKEQVLSLILGEPVCCENGKCMVYPSITVSKDKAHLNWTTYTK